MHCPQAPGGAGRNFLDLPDGTAHAGAMVLNAAQQNPADAFQQAARLVWRDGIGGLERVQLAEVQGFVRVNIAQPGEKTLIQ